MGRLLTALIAETVPAAKAAKVAKVSEPLPVLSQDSQLSQRVGFTKPEPAGMLALLAQRDRLHRLADAEGIDPALIDRLDDDDLTGCIGLSTDTLAAYVRALRDSDLRERGKVPADETARALCRSCGPVWVAPEVAAVAPVVDSWPRLLGCPWCHVKNRKAMCRPQVRCGDCQHFACDTVNPAQGMGHCSAGCDPERPYPIVKHECSRFSPRGAT